MFRYIPNWQNKGLTCHFCKTTKSVKYEVCVDDALVPTCNRCVLMYGVAGGRKDLWEFHSSDKMRKEND